MKKSVKIIIYIILIIISLIILIALYLYYVHIFKTFRVCISDSDYENLNISCQNKEECLNLVIDNSPEIKNAIDTTPRLINEKIIETLNQAVFCDNTCKIKRVRGSGIYQDLGNIKCNPGEKEIKLDIRGKEAYEIYMFTKLNQK